jgi:hypothetical protein
MKKLILMTALIAISLQGSLYAQSSHIAKRMSKSKTELTFNANVGLLNLRDFVTLKEGRMILELSDVSDYESFRNLDSLLALFMKDIAFYKDSLDADATGHVRIDYALCQEYSFKKIRFKNYAADGSVFLNQAGELAKLKMEQDTIRILIQKAKPGLGSRRAAPCSIPYTIQATFLLNNYKDINKIISDKVLKRIVDTLEKESQMKRVVNNVYSNPLSIIYNPYFSGKGGFMKYSALLKSEYDNPGSYRKRNTFTVNVNVGAGLVRSVLAPMAEIGMQFTKYQIRDNIKDYDYIRISIAPYYFFDKDAQGNYLVNDNWFLNASTGTKYARNEDEWFGKNLTFGIGYLLIQKGGYFKNTTFKAFTDIEIMRGLTIVPELYFTNNFKQIFPGFTLKIF